MTTEQDLTAPAAVVIRAVDGKSYREEREKELQELRKRRLAVKLLREGFEKALSELSQEDEATRIELLSQRKLELIRLREAGLTSARKGDLAHASTEAELHAEEEKIRIELLRLEAIQRKLREEEEAKRKKAFEEAEARKKREEEAMKREAEEEETNVKKVLEDKKETKEEKALEGDAERSEALESEGLAKMQKDKEQIEGDEQQEGLKELVEDKEGTDSLDSKELVEGEEAFGEAKREIKLLESEELVEGEKALEVDTEEIEALKADLQAEGGKAFGEGKGETLEAKEPADREKALAVDKEEIEALEAHEEAKGDSNQELLEETLEDVPGSADIISSVCDVDAGDMTQQISNSSLHQLPFIDCHATQTIDSKEAENVCPDSQANEKTFVDEIVEAFYVQKEAGIVKQKESTGTLPAQHFDEDRFSLDKKDPDASWESPFIKAVGDIASEVELKIGLLDNNCKIDENNEEEILVLPATDNLNSLLAVKSAEDINATTQEVSVPKQIFRTEANKQNMGRYIDTYSSEAPTKSVPDDIIPGRDFQHTSPFDPHQKSAEYAQNNGPLAIDFSPVTKINLMKEAAEHVEADGILQARKEVISKIDLNPVLKSAPRIDAYDGTNGEIAYPPTNGDVVIMEDLKSNEMITEDTEPMSLLNYTSVIASNGHNSIKMKTELRTIELGNFNQNRDNEETMAKMKAEFKQSLELATDKRNDDAISAYFLTGSLDGEETKSCIAAEKVEGILDDDNAYDSSFRCSNAPIDMAVVEEELTLQDAKTIKDAPPFSLSKVLTSKNLETVSYSMVDSISAGEMSPSSSMGGSPERMHAAGKSNPIPHYARFRTISRNSYDRAYYTNTKEKTEETR